MCASLQTAHNELRDSEQQLAHANRVATMEQSTASIGHEVKQPIAAMVANAQAALRFLDFSRRIGRRCARRSCRSFRRAIARATSSTASAASSRKGRRGKSTSRSTD